MTAFITTAHQKGGVGKSTLALNLYGYFVKSGLNVAIVDIDPQGTITQYSDFLEAGKLHLIKRNDFSTFEELAQKTKEFDVVVIDTPPYLTNELEEVLKITNFLIIPCKASLFDALAIRQTVAFIEDFKKRHKREFISTVVLTMVISGASLQGQIRDVLKQYNMPVLTTEIGNRVAYAKSLLLSGSVIDDDSGKARTEIENLATEILSLISNS